MSIQEAPSHAMPSQFKDYIGGGHRWQEWKSIDICSFKAKISGLAQADMNPHR
jgi:hypothetical protein